MPKISDVIKTEEITLPYSGAKVQCVKALTVMQQNEIQAETDNLKSGLLILRAVIKSWDFVDDEGKELPVTLESVGSIPDEDAAFIIRHAGQLFKERADFIQAQEEKKTAAEGEKETPKTTEESAK